MSAFISGHTDKFAPCPLYFRQRTFVAVGGMSEKCQKRTLLPLDVWQL